MHKEVVIIGGGIAGLVSANICSHLGFESLLLERSPALGGANRSITDRLGNVFDAGWHALDYERSKVSTRFFKKVLKSDYNKVKLNRGIVLKDSVIPYNSDIDAYPSELQAMYDLCDSSEPINQPSRSELSWVFGKQFADYMCDEVSLSYPCHRWAVEHGALEQTFLGLVYPWFFPQRHQSMTRDKEWDQFHDRMRETGDQFVLYPKHGGFSGFIDAIADSINQEYCEIRTGVNDIEFEIDQEERSIKKAYISGEELTADLWLWNSSPAILGIQLGCKIPPGEKQFLVLGSFAFENDFDCEHQEILVGSLKHRINRISFPGTLSGKRNNLIQVEFMYPGNEYELSEEEWKSSWLESLSSLNLVTQDNTLLNYQFNSEMRGFVFVDGLEAVAEDFKSQLGKLASNTVIPYFNLGPENINRVLPGVIRTVSNALSTIK